MTFSGSAHLQRQALIGRLTLSPFLYEARRTTPGPDVRDWEDRTKPGAFGSKEETPVGGSIDWERRHPGVRKVVNDVKAHFERLHKQLPNGLPVEYHSVKHVDHRDPAQVHLLADVVNLGAKEMDEKLYDHKHKLIHAALRMGSEGGWAPDERGSPVFYMRTPGAGTSSYHDPSGQIRVPESQKWYEPWDRIRRQDFAPALLRSYQRGGRAARLMAAVTSGKAGPAVLRRARRYVDGIWQNKERSQSLSQGLTPRFPKTNHRDLRLGRKPRD